ncbi:hemolysin III family protein [Gemmata sp. G18]|uniref:Hemolysin III family protein n=1 Tax=Gemmata palustris TaxID=2822762 RepID=A0ABS5BPH2_9BACT|nr:hemolysin III family protein [Gemmata palustris]MBP3955629.1 hemolysin III family protein [Gemmata palustris]
MELRDPVSSASHLFAAAWAAYATLIMLRLTPVRSGRRPAVAVFGASMVFLYLASGVFHGVPYTRYENPEAFRFFQRVDQSAIFILIAGTNTPMIVVLLRGRWRRCCLLGMWVPTAVGVAGLWLLPKAPHEAIVVLGLAMGWVGLLPLVHYYRAVGRGAMNWVWTGGVLYSAGAVCELIEWPMVWEWPLRFGFHEVFHLFSVAANVTFFLFVVRYVIPFDATGREEITPDSTRERDESFRSLVHSNAASGLPEPTHPEKY